MNPSSTAKSRQTTDFGPVVVLKAPGYNSTYKKSCKEMGPSGPSGFAQKFRTQFLPCNDLRLAGKQASHLRKSNIVANAKPESAILGLKSGELGPRGQDIAPLEPNRVILSYLRKLTEFSPEYRYQTDGPVSSLSLLSSLLSLSLGKYKYKSFVIELDQKKKQKEKEIE